MRPKKNFTLKIKDTGKIYAMGCETDTYLKNRIVMFCYRAAGFLAVKEVRPAGLFINGRYMGYYGMTELYSEEELKKYKRGEICELYKVHLDSYEEYPLSSKTEKKFPDDDDYSSLNILINNVTSMDDETLADFVKEYVDIEDLVKYAAVHDFFAVKDTKVQNFYIYNYGKMVILPWDNELGMELYDSAVYGDNFIIKRILSLPFVKKKYEEAMKKWFLDAGSEVFLTDILKEKVKEFFEGSKTAAKSDPVFYQSYGDFEKSKDNILYFLENRSNFLKEKKYFE